MNPLATLPASDSPRGSLNETDFLKVGRMLLVQAFGLGLTLTIPWLLSLSYVWYGFDVTPYILIVVNAAAELMRRFVANNHQPEIATLGTL